MTGWPILSTVTFLPLVGAFLILLIRDDGGSARRNIRNVARFPTNVYSTATTETNGYELELTANVEIVTKDGQPTLNLDISGESSNARTVRLKFNTKVNPAPEKEEKK